MTNDRKGSNPPPPAYEKPAPPPNPPPSNSELAELRGELDAARAEIERLRRLLYGFRWHLVHGDAEAAKLSGSHGTQA